MRVKQNYKARNIMKQLDKHRERLSTLRRARNTIGCLKVRIEIDLVWIDGLLFVDFGTISNSKIASFDAGSTLVIRDKIGNTNIKSKEWRWWDVTVPQKLREIHQEGFKIVIFTNQDKITRGKVTIDELKTRFTEIYNELKIPFQVFAALK